MARAATHEPNVVRTRVTIDDEVAVRCVGVLADSCFDQRCTRQRRETVLQMPLRASHRLGTRQPVDVGGIEWRAPRVVCDLETPGRGCRESVIDGFAKIDPHGEVALIESGVTSRRTHIIDLLPRRDDEISDDIRKHSSKPRPTRKHELVGRQRRPVGQGEMGQRATRPCTDTNVVLAVVASLCDKAISQHPTRVADV